MSASTPDSSSTSRQAVSSGVSPHSMWPLGSTHGWGGRLARTRRKCAAPPRTAVTTPPACVRRGTPSPSSTRRTLVGSAEFDEAALDFFARETLGALAARLGDGGADGTEARADVKVDERLGRPSGDLG